VKSKPAAVVAKPLPKVEKPISAPVVIRLDTPEAKGKPLKSLSSLDKFFSR